MTFSGNRPRIGELLWDPNKALDLFSLIKLTRMYFLSGGIPAELVAVIFFEETAFCNVRQTRGRDKQTKSVLWGPGVGFGQLQIYDPEKREFFASIGFNNDVRNTSSSLPLITFDMVTNHPRFSVFLTCRYLEFILKKKQSEGKGGIDAVLGAQTGAGGTGDNAKRNALLIPRWKTAAAELKGLLANLQPNAVETLRPKIARVLNSGRHEGFAIPFPNFTDYWKFVVPADMGLAMYEAV